MSNSESYLKDDDHYAELVARLNPGDARAFHKTRHARVITASPGWEMYVYRMVERKPVILTRVAFIDFTADEMGINTEVVDLTTNERLVVGHAPTRLFDYIMFLSIPLHCVARYRVTPQGVGKPGKLTWPVFIRTESRKHLREVGVTYCETKRAFEKEFEQQPTE